MKIAIMKNDLQILNRFLINTDKLKINNEMLS